VFHQLAAQRAQAFIHGVFRSSKKRIFLSLCTLILLSAGITIIALLTGGIFTMYFNEIPFLQAMENVLSGLCDDLSTPQRSYFLFVLVGVNLLSDSFSLCVTYLCVLGIRNRTGARVLLYPLLDILVAFLLSALCRAAVISVYFRRNYITHEDILNFAQDNLLMIWGFLQSPDVRSAAVGSSGFDFVAPMYSSTTLLPTLLLFLVWYSMFLARAVCLPAKHFTLWALDRVAGDEHDPGHTTAKEHPCMILSACVCAGLIVTMLIALLISIAL